MSPTNLETRIRWILSERQFSQRELSRKAGLSDGYISARLTQLQTNPGGSMDGPDAAAVAKAANVSLEWLLTGEGRPEKEERLEDRLRPLGEREGWVEARASAQEFQGRPDRYYDEAAQWRAPTKPMTAELVASIVDAIVRTESRG